jgi:serine/threonine protein kinase
MIEHSSLDKLAGTTIGDYRLERHLGQGNWGPLFLAGAGRTAPTYLLQILAGPSKLVAKDQQVYLERFQHQMSQVANLQHPNILPLLDYGMYRGMFYLVSPYIPMRSLHTRLAKSGRLDIFTTGRYLDQISTTLEYAHQNAMIHGNLSVDCIYIRLDGQLVVSDFGVRNLLLIESVGMLNEWSGAWTPEQLLGKPVGTYTDVYALGAVLYALLIGTPVFPGKTSEEIAQQHLYASVPPLNRGRYDLPAGLYSIIARALAKDPTQRYHRPGGLANAYNRIVAPNDKLRVPFIVDPSPAKQAQRPPVSKVAISDIQFTEQKRSDNGSTAPNLANGMSVQRAKPETPSPPALPVFPVPDPLRERDTRQSSLLHRFWRRNVRRTALLALLMIILLLASSVAGAALLLKRSNTNNTAPGASGQVMFFDGQNGSQGHTDALNIIVHGLNTPPTGSQYAAWLINEQSEQVVALGTLTGTKQTFSLSYSGEDNNGQGSINLLAMGEEVEVTLEQGTVKLPAGQVILLGKFPPQAFAHIQHLLVSFPATPGKIGVLVGVLEQTHLLNVQADVLQGLAPAHNSVAIQCAAQSIIDVIEGSQGPHYRPLAGLCATQNITATGDGFGLAGKGYLADAAEHAILAITQPDATNTMRLHAKLMAVALSNIKGWVTIIEQDALQLLKNPADQTKIQEIVRLADDAYHGVDVNGDGQIDPVAGEAGALTAYLQGQLMATLSLAPNT